MYHPVLNPLSMEPCRHAGVKVPFLHSQLVLSRYPVPGTEWQGHRAGPDAAEKRGDGRALAVKEAKVQ
jgi:hypothetical protein